MTVNFPQRILMANSPQGLNPPNNSRPKFTPKIASTPLQFHFSEPNFSSRRFSAYGGDQLFAVSSLLFRLDVVRTKQTRVQTNGARRWGRLRSYPGQSGRSLLNCAVNSPFCPLFNPGQVGFVPGTISREGRRNIGLVLCVDLFYDQRKIKATTKGQNRFRTPGLSPSKQTALAQ